MRKAARAHRENARDERDNSEAGDRRRRFAQRHKRDDGGDQRGEPAHDRIGDREVGASIELSDQDEIDDMDERRRDDERQGRARRPRQDESGQKSGHAAPDRDDRRRKELVVRALDERVPQRMKGRSAKYGGQNAGTEVSGIGHERVTVMDSLAPVEPRGDPANRQRARAEARGAFARVGARTEPAAAVRDRRPPLALSALVEPVRSGDRQHRRRRRGRQIPIP